MIYLSFLLSFCFLYSLFFLLLFLSFTYVFLLSYSLLLLFIFPFFLSLFLVSHFLIYVSFFHSCQRANMLAHRQKLKLKSNVNIDNQIVCVRNFKQSVSICCCVFSVLCCPPVAERGTAACVCLCFSGLLALCSLQASGWT